MNCILIDDEPKALSVLRKYVEKVPYLNLISEFRSSLDALSFLSENKVDLIFLDINMPDLNGLEFLKSLDKSPMIIFCTAHADYAIESFEWDTIGYLLKPISFSQFLKFANKAHSHFKMNALSAHTPIQKSEPAHIWIKSGVKSHQVALSDILYVEASGNHVFFFTRDKKIISLNSLKEISELLPKFLFQRIHKSFIVAIQHIEVLERHQLQVQGKSLPIGKTYRAALFKLLNT